MIPVDETLLDSLLEKFRQFQITISFAWWIGHKNQWPDPLKETKELPKNLLEVLQFATMGWGKANKELIEQVLLSGEGTVSFAEKADFVLREMVEDSKALVFDGFTSFPQAWITKEHVEY